MSERCFLAQSVLSLPLTCLALGLVGFRRWYPILAWLATIRLMARLKVTALAIEAGKTLMIDREELLREADAQGISIVALE